MVQVVKQMNLHKLILTNNDCYKAGRKITPKGVMVHSTGANNPNLKRYIQPNDGLLGTNPNNNDWNRSGIELGVHAFIGKLADGTIATYQTLPWNHRAWHCGSGKNGSGNNTHISFEICEDGLTDRNYFNKVYNEAVELTAYLCEMYSFNPLKDGVVICHSEGHSRGIASNHSDVMHWFPKHGKSMDTFRQDVYNKMNQQEEDEMTEELKSILNNINNKLASIEAVTTKKMIYNYIDENLPDWATPTIQKLVRKGYLQGTGDGLNLDDTMLRLLVILDRAGVFGE